MHDLLTDARTAIKTFTAVREARAEGLEPSVRVLVEMPVINAGPSFYDTLEGCMFANRDKELRNAVREVFNGLSDEDKRVLCSVPENGRFLVRAALWSLELELVLPSRLYHKAMGAILHQLVKAKLNQIKAVSVCQQK